MKRAIIWILAFLSLIPVGFSLSADANDELFDRTLILAFHDQNTYTSNSSLVPNWAGTASGSPVRVASGPGTIVEASHYYTSGGGADNVDWINSSVWATVKNATCMFWFNESTDYQGGNFRFFYTFGDGANGGQSGEHRAYFSDTQAIVYNVYSSAGEITISYGPTINEAHLNMMTLRRAENSTRTEADLYINTTRVATGNNAGTIDIYTGNGNYLQISHSIHSGIGRKGIIDELACFNKSLDIHEITHYWNVTRRGIHFNGTASQPADTTPPKITFYNMTSEGGCTNWNTDKTNPCSTSDITPTVFVNTSEAAFCRIGVSNLNYTNLGSSRECSGSASLQHTCNLNLTDELFYETSYVYIGCKDSSSNENSTSTSGALALNITGLETTARNLIEVGIRNSLSSGYTIYTDQKIYARNSANTQAVGTFDKVAKKLSKIWAFNRIGTSDSLVNMFNITPVLYTLEFANKTSVQITNQTELLINATK